MLVLEDCWLDFLVNDLDFLWCEDSDDEGEEDVEGMIMMEQRVMEEQLELQRKLRAHKVGKFSATVDSHAKALGPSDRFSWLVLLYTRVNWI